ncbi:hypothetical protein MMC09_006945 [Bachmanniomyces sp. S44760]|nr:hypothetical protein [Bachmanniomyces sp. S44760]
MSTSDKPNLARIRDNQRRSRARRKEYLNELEEKYRKCELLGVEASAEIQAAARRVAEENRRLKTFLHARGISDDEIDDQLGNVANTSPRSCQPTTSQLEYMLDTRKPCCGQTLRDTGASSQSSGKKASAMISSQPVSITTSVLPSASAAAPSLCPQYDHIQATSTLDEFSNTTAMPIDAQPHNLVNWIAFNEFDYPDEHQVHDVDVQHTSCTVAARMISTMRDDVSTDGVKSEFGCFPATECKIPNTTLLDVMDRYTLAARHST